MVENGPQFKLRLRQLPTRNQQIVDPITAIHHRLVEPAKQLGQRNCMLIVKRQLIIIGQIAQNQRRYAQRKRSWFALTVRVGQHHHHLLAGSG